MDLFQAIILGVVQGLTEFIPISSTAHLVFAGRLTDLYGGDPEKITATMAVIQLGTLAAVFVYFARDIWNISTSFLADHLALLTGRDPGRSPGTGAKPARLSVDTRIGWLIVIGSVPVGIAGLLFKDTIEGSLTKNLWLIGSMLVGVALLLIVAEWLGRQRKELSDMGVADSLIVGFTQVLALVPGASRSGSTIMGGLFAGLKREAAARFSFLLMIPAITASGLLELYEAWHLLPPDVFLPLLAGTIVAGIVGYLTIWFLLAFLKRHSTFIFIIYRIALGAAILLLLSTGTISAG